MKPRAPTFVDVERERCSVRRSGSLRVFVEKAWPQVVPGEAFVAGWHIDAICEHLEAVTRGDLGYLIINVPPGHMKSLLTNIFWPAWVWKEHPELKWIFGSGVADLAVRDSIKMRDLITSDWYQARWGQTLQLSATSRDTQKEYETTQKGFRLATSVGSSVIGRHAHVQVIDDPLTAQEAYSEAARQEALRWINESLSTRWVPGAPQKRVLIMQRLHEQDPTGYLLAQGGYEHLCLPMEYEPDRTSATSIGWTDPRTEPGEILWPVMWTPEKLDVRKKELGTYGTAGQLQQRPAPSEGGLIKRTSFQFYRKAQLPERFDSVEICVDATFDDKSKTKKGNDRVAMAVWGAYGPKSYLLHMVCRPMGYVQTRATLLELIQSWPKATRRRIEKKANGAALLDELSTIVSGLVLYEPKESKEARVHACLPQIEAGNVHLPHPDDAPWVRDYLDELAMFPNGAHDDQVDATTMYLIHRINSNLERFKRMAAL